MDKKTKQAYIHLLQYINENIYKMEPNSFMTDYETSLQNALKVVFPNAQCYGCWFHYCQAIRRNISKKHSKLAELIRANGQASVLYHKILSLPLLPAKSIPVTLYILKEEISNIDNFNGFSKFFNYFEKQWMKKVCTNFLI